MIKRKLILLSKSPRRSQLLREAGFDFEVKKIDVDESFPDDLPEKEVAEFIARKKAEAGKEWVSENNAVITADTIVYLDGKIYEKPVDKADAIRILNELSGKTHTVITGVAIATTEGVTSFSDKTKVRFSSLSQEEIEFYLDKWKPYDKAGSYGIQEWIGHCKIEKMKGSYTNVMGLPVQRLYEELRKMEKMR